MITTHGLTHVALAVSGAFPAPCLVLIGLYLGLNGAGRYSVDHRLEAGARRLPA